MTNRPARDLLPMPYGGIDAGGTKWVCAVGTSPADVRGESATIPTTTPEETLARVAEFFLGWKEKHGDIAAIGASSFGPLIRDTAAKDWGCLYNSPKAGWENARIGPYLREALKGVPIGMDTDVNGAALAEQQWGSAMGLDDLVYLTIGTGVGGAVIANGQLVNGTMHPEIGHIRPPRHPSDDYDGLCPYHGHCYEGLISGPAIRDSRMELAKKKRLDLEKFRAEDIADDDPIWDFVAYYLGTLCSTLLFTLSTRKIILGGGVMSREHLLPKVHENVVREIGGYLRDSTEENIKRLIARSAWVEHPRSDDLNAGVFGGFLIAEQALQAEINK